jgi:purine nucleoside phosphorylase
MAKYLGCHSALITNAAGGMNPAFSAGDVMLIEDHINFIGSNPLRGPNPPELGGPRFLDLSEPYDPAYRAALQETAAELGLPRLQSGVYVGVSGPTYETRAEIRFFRVRGVGVGVLSLKGGAGEGRLGHCGARASFSWERYSALSRHSRHLQDMPEHALPFNPLQAAGADAVGMSTVPEVIAARHLGMRVAALSCITNMACGLEEGQVRAWGRQKWGHSAIDSVC